MTPKAIRNIIIALLATIGLVFCADGMIMVVAADEIVVRQGAIDGKLTVWTDPGPHLQNFGTITTYKRAFQYSFSSAKDQGEGVDQSIKVRFNDGGHGNVSGTFRATLPLSPDKMRRIHTQYHSMDAVTHQLLRPALERSAYMSGPFMSSKESAAERRAELFNLIEDQLTRGVCKVASRDEKISDPLSGKDRTVKIVQAVVDAKTGACARQEGSPLQTYGIGVDSFNLNTIAYDSEVEGQIKAQQKLAMDVQTAIAEAKKAEQKAITVAKQGEADAAQAKWKQEVIKAQEVTKAQQEKEVAVLQAQKAKDVAELDKQAAEFEKQKLVLLGEGEASRARAVMQANGYLPERLAAWKEVNIRYAEEIGKQPQVPSVVVGGDGNVPNGQNIMQFLQLRSMQDLGIKMDGLKR